MLQLKNVSLQLGSKILLDQANLTINLNQKIGIVGSNGAGKTSLFRLITKELTADQGEITISENLRWATLQQDMPCSTQNIVDYVLAGDPELMAIYQQLKTAEHQANGMAIAELHTQLGNIDGYTAKNRAAKILVGLGFSQADLENAVNDFSGGWRMRLNLARLLLSRADIMLLDEPTNHLDLEAILWLEEWLADCQNTLLIISHDRDFLDKVTTHTVHCLQQKLKLYSGNYSAFEIQYAEALTLQQATHVKLERKRAHLQKFVDRFRYKASKAKQAQSRLKLLERMEHVAAVQLQNPFQFKFLETKPVGNPALKLTDIVVSYDQSTILSDIRLSLTDSDRIGLLGQNGAGKSTFMKLLAGKLTATSGDYELSDRAKIGYYAQHQLDDLDNNTNALTHLQRIDKNISESQARNYLGRFNFSGDMVFSCIKNFSGGERARLALALLIYTQPNILLLDEPTNHLDMEMRAALIEALQEFTGALIVVSHDRYFLNSIINQYWLVANHTVQAFPGDINDYNQWLKKPNPTQLQVADDNTPAAADKVNPYKLNKQINQSEAKIKTIVKKIADLDNKLSANEIYQDENKTRLLELNKKRNDLAHELQILEDDLLALLVLQEKLS